MLFAWRNTMEIGDKGFQAKKTDEIALPSGKKAMDRKNESGSENNNLQAKESVQDAMENTKRMIALEQLAISGLKHIKAGIRIATNPTSHENFVDDVIDITRFENEPVLQEYKQVLNEAFRSKDLSRIDAIIEKINNRVKLYYAEMGKSEITNQNLLSVPSFGNGKSPDELIQSVIASIKKENLPHFTLKRERILDLLGE